MKNVYFIITLVVFFVIGFTVSIAKADECSDHTQTSKEEIFHEFTTDVPAHLKGATITVTLKDGSQSSVPAEKFKVVPRVQEWRVQETIVATERTCRDIDRHRVSLLVGKGPKEGLDRDNSNAPNEVKVESRVGVYGGLQYQYKTDLKLFGAPVSVGGQIQNNKSGAGLLGLDF